MTGLLTPATPSPEASVAAALGGALCWTLATVLWRRIPDTLSATQLNVGKTLLALVLQLPLLALVQWPAGQGVALLALALSGVVGIALGDSLFFAALRRLGTRRSLTLTAGGPAVTALVGLVALGERPRPLQWLGIALICLAVGLVAQQQPRRGQGSRSGGTWAGVGLALMAMVCGSAGALMARWALRSGTVPALLAATVRLGGGSLALAPALAAALAGLARRPPRDRRRALASLPWPSLVVATLLGTSLGILLQQIALAGLPGGLAVALLSTSPVMALPLAALEGDRPGWTGRCAALAATVGVSLVAGLAG